MDKLLIGLDFGSDSVRALLVTTQGKVLASSVHAFSRWQDGLYCNAVQSQFRQHPLDYLEGTEAVIKAVLKGQDATERGRTGHVGGRRHHRGRRAGHGDLAMRTGHQ